MQPDGSGLENVAKTGGRPLGLAFDAEDRLLIADAERPFIRKIIYRMPEAIQPKPERHGLVLALDGDGQVVHNLQDATGKVAVTSGAVEHEGMIYVGSLEDAHIARMPVPK